MWRRVTRGLVLAVLVSLVVPALLAQVAETRGNLDFPDPTVTQSGVILVKGWFLDPALISRMQFRPTPKASHNIAQGSELASAPWVKRVRRFIETPTGFHIRPSL